MPFVIRLTALNESYYWNDEANAFGPLKKASIYPELRPLRRSLWSTISGAVSPSWTARSRTGAHYMKTGRTES